MYNAAAVEGRSGVGAGLECAAYAAVASWSAWMLSLAESGSDSKGVPESS